MAARKKAAPKAEQMSKAAESDALAALVAPVEREVGGDTLALITAAVDEREELVQLAALLEVHQKIIGARILAIETTRIPDLMAAAGASKVRTKSGIDVEVKPFLNASIVKDSKDAALDWLIENEHGGIIKQAVEVSFSAGDEETPKLVDSLKATLDELGFTYVVERDVHHQTLQKFAREHILENGGNLPDGLFTTFTGNRAILKRAK